MGAHKQSRSADGCAAMLIQTLNKTLFASVTHQNAHKQFVLVQM